jgi:hypothetical protein
MFHIVIISASAHLNGLYIESSAGHSHPLPYFAFPGWGVVVIVDSSYSPADSLSFAIAAQQQHCAANSVPPPLYTPTPPIQPP